MASKKRYEAPEVRSLGEVKTLTQGGRGLNFDGRIFTRRPMGGGGGGGGGVS